MFVRLVVVFAPLAALSAAHLAGLVLLLSSEHPGLITAALLSTVAAVAVHIREQTRVPTGPRRATRKVIGQLVLWATLPAICFAVPLIAIVLVSASTALKLTFGVPYVLIGLGLALAWIVTLVTLERPFGTRSATRSLLRSLRPLFLATIPVGITFIPVIGGLSSVVIATMVTQLADGRIGHAPLFGGIEAAACVAMVLLWSWITRVWLQKLMVLGCSHRRSARCRSGVPHSSMGTWRRVPYRCIRAHQWTDCHANFRLA
jgi:hypothetical protein